MSTKKIHTLGCTGLGGTMKLALEYLMKMILALLILHAVIVLPAICQTPQNAVETDIAVIKTEIKNIKELMSTGFDNVQQQFDNVQQQFDNVQKGFDRQNNIIIACIGIPWAILAIGATVWGILAHRRSRKDHTFEKQIETLTQEIETLKQQRILQS